MCGAIERTYLRDPGKLKSWVSRRFGVDLSYPEDLVTLASELPGFNSGLSWAGDKSGSSAGVVAWVKSRLNEARLLPGTGLASEADDLPMVERDGIACIPSVARSKMFLTNLAVAPIDLVSGRVAGLTFRFKVRKG